MTEAEEAAKLWALRDRFAKWNTSFGDAGAPLESVLTELGIKRPPPPESLSPKDATPEMLHVVEGLVRGWSETSATTLALDLPDVRHALRHAANALNFAKVHVCEKTRETQPDHPFTPRIADHAFRAVSDAEGHCIHQKLESPSPEKPPIMCGLPKDQHPAPVLNLGHAFVSPSEVPVCQHRGPGEVYVCGFAEVEH